jgi:hypothetical protein
LVFAIAFKIICIEKYFDMLWKQRVIKLGGIIVGLTQIEISTVVKEYDELYAYSFDVDNFDHTVPQLVLVLGYWVLENALPLSIKQVKILRYLRNVMLTLPLFHPNLDFMPRKRGLNSGSGLTNTLGSITMFVMHSIVLFKYCRIHGINLGRIKTKITVSSDDSIIGLSLPLNVIFYVKLFYKTFGMTLDHEATAKPGISKVEFLGSLWTNGVPTRSVERMFGRICFGTGNFPIMDEKTLFASRCFEILGNDGRFDKLWASFNLRMPDKVFRFVEIADYNAQLKIREYIEHTNSSENRGLWLNIADLKAAGLAGVWMTR